MLDFCLSMLLGTAAGLGVGGGGLLVLYLAGVRGMQPYAAQGINLLFYLCAVLGALPVHIKKQTLSLRLLLELSALGIPASVLGALLGAHIPQRAARIALGCFLLLGGALALLFPLLQKRFCAKKDAPDRQY